MNEGSSVTGDGDDPIQLLQDDHRRIQRLLSELEGNDAADAQNALVEAITSEFAAHATIEEELLYPALRDAGGDSARIARESVDQHEEVREVLAELAGMSSGDAGFAQRLDALILELRRHIEREEDLVFARLSGVLGTERLGQIGVQMAEARRVRLSRAEPTRPEHVHLPDDGGSGRRSAP